VVALSGATGAFESEVNLLYPPIRNVALGQLNAGLVLVLMYRPSDGVSMGEVLDIANLQNRIGIWAFETNVRSFVQRRGLVLHSNASSEDFVVAAFLSTGLTAAWARLSGGGIAEFGTTDAGSLQVASPPGDTLSAAGAASTIAVTDGISVFQIQLNRREPEVIDRQIFLQTPLTGISQLIAHSTGEFVGIANGPSVVRPFSATFPSSFFAWPSFSPEVVGEPIADDTWMYFPRSGGSYSYVCTVKRNSLAYTCANANPNEEVSGIALGTNRTLYTVVRRVSANATYLQNRDRSTLAVRSEFALPGVVGACNTLTITCIAGKPAAGCVDSVGRLVFVSVDEGIETSAGWPMEGHDPGRTFNASTPLEPYSCP
jgi:hypothetical protein